MSREQWTRACLTLAILLAPVGFLGHLAANDPDVSFLATRDGAEWIQHRLPVRLGVREGEEFAPTTVFQRDFVVRDLDPRAAIDVRAMSLYRARLNGEEVIARAPAEDWKQSATIELGPALRRDRNHLHIEVACEGGPPSLWVRARNLPAGVSTGPGWAAGPSAGPFRPATSAAARFPQPFDGEGAGPIEAARKRSGLLLALFCVSMLAFLLRGRVAPLLPAFLASAPNAATLVACAAWLALFVNNALAAPFLMGPDLHGHAGYLRFILEERTLPLAIDGWSTYHPPLFYLLSALAHVATGGAVLALKLLPFAAGLGQILLARWATRLVFPERPVAQALGIVFAATIPMNLYVSQFFTNEGLSGLLIGLVLCQAIAMSTHDPSAPRDHALLGLFCGLALLTKFTAVIALAVALAVLVAEMRRRGRGLARIAASLGVTLAVTLAIAGWFYVRNQMALGAPFPGNWQFRWWQDPGFITPDYLTRFGGWLTNPFKVGLNSFFDSLYATFWGDAMMSAMGSTGGRVTWDRDLVAVAILLGAPSLVLLAVGGAKAIAAVVRKGDPAWSLVLLSSFGQITLVAYAITTHPYYSVAKSFLAMGAIVPFALLLAFGFEAVDGFLSARAPALRALAYGWLGTLAGVVFLAYLL